MGGIQAVEPLCFLSGDTQGGLRAEHVAWVAGLAFRFWCCIRVAHACCSPFGSVVPPITAARLLQTTQFRMKLSLLVAAAAAVTASGAVTKIPMKKTPLTLKGVKEGVWYHRGMLGKLARDYNLGGSGSVVIQTVCTCSLVVPLFFYAALYLRHMHIKCGDSSCARHSNQPTHVMPQLPCTSLADGGCPVLRCVGFYEKRGPSRVL